MKRVPYLAQEELRKTAAWQILRDPSLDADGTRKAMRLIHCMEQAIKKSPSAEKNHLHIIGFSDLKTELTENVELHAGIDCLRIALKATNPEADKTVFPSREIPSKDKRFSLSPLQYAEHLTEKYPQLGQLLTRYLTTHEKTLEYKKEQAQIASKHKRYDNTDYARYYTPAELDAWR